MNDPYNLHRFIDAQSIVYGQVERELAKGRKESHWMWFIFPQLVGLGSSAISRRFAITSLDEARAYLEHPLLSARLRDCTNRVLQTGARVITDVFDFPDDRKFFSSMTLFALTEDRIYPFQNALDQFFHSKMEFNTVSRLQGAR